MPWVPIIGVLLYRTLHFSSAVAITFAGTHYAYRYLQRDGQAELAWLACLNAVTVCMRMGIHRSIKPAYCGAILFVCPVMLIWYQTVVIVLVIFSVEFARFTRPVWSVAKVIIFTFYTFRVMSLFCEAGV